MYSYANYGLLFALTLLMINLMIFINQNEDKNLIMLMMSLELMLLSISKLFFHVSFILDDMNGSFISLLILPLAGAESAMFLSMLMAYYPKKGSLMLGN